MNKYKFECGCEFDILDEKIKSDGLPSINIDFNKLAIGLNYGYYCPNVWKLLGEGKTKGVFQLESDLGNHWATETKPEDLGELAALISIIRPGTLQSKDESGRSLTQTYADRKSGKEDVEITIPALGNILKETYQVLVYQEQAIRITQEIAGFTEEEADKLRKAIGKKDAKVMADVKSKFLIGCKNTKIVGENDALKIFSWIQESQRYSFNKSHGVGYGMTGYQTAFTKEHFPLHFFASWLKHARDKQDPHDRVRELIDEAKLFDINVLLPTLYTLDYNNNDVCIDGTSVRFGLRSMKGVKDSVLEKTNSVISECKTSIGKDLQDFNWNDFLFHLAPKLKITTVKSLITGGILEYGKPRGRMLYEFEKIKSLTKKQLEHISEYSDLELVDAIEKIKPKVNINQKKKLTDLQILLEKETHKTTDSPSWIIRQEKEIFGVPITYNPIEILKQSTMGDTTCKEFNDGKEGDMSIVGELTEVRKFKIKNGKKAGEMMSICKLHDGNNAITIVLFSESFRENDYTLYKGNCVTVFGERGRQGSLIVRTIKEIY